MGCVVLRVVGEGVWGLGEVPLFVGWCYRGCCGVPGFLGAGWCSGWLFWVLAVSGGDAMMGVGWGGLADGAGSVRLVHGACG